MKNKEFDHKDFDKINEEKIIDVNELSVSEIYLNQLEPLKTDKYKETSLYDLLFLLRYCASSNLNRNSKSETDVFTAFIEHPCHFLFKIEDLTEYQLTFLYNSINKIKNIALKTRILDIIYVSKKLNKKYSSIIPLLIDSYFELCKRFADQINYNIDIYIRLLQLTYILDRQDTRKDLIELILITQISIHQLKNFSENINPKKIDKDQLKKVIAKLDSKDKNQINYNFWIYDTLIKLDKTNKKEYEIKKSLLHIAFANITNCIFTKIAHLKLAKVLYKSNSKLVEVNELQAQIEVFEKSIPSEKYIIFNNKEINDPITATNFFLDNFILNKAFFELFVKSCNLLEPLRIKIDDRIKSALSQLDRKTNFEDALKAFFEAIEFVPGDEITACINKAYDNTEDDHYNSIIKNINVSQLGAKGEKQTCNIGTKEMVTNHVLAVFFFKQKEYIIKGLNILSKFTIDVSLLKKLVQDNKYCAEQTNSVLNGIFMFLIKDIVISSYLLVPQIEEHLRRKLREAVINTVNDKENGVALSKTNIIFFIEKCKEKKLISSLQAFYLSKFLSGYDKNGCNIRNDLAHGKLTDQRILCGGDIINLLYLFIQMVIQSSSNNN